MIGWKKFEEGSWISNVDVKGFILSNYKEYQGDDTFLKKPTEKTKKLWEKCKELLKEELKKGILDVEVNEVAGINNFKPGYIDKENEVIFGLQTDAPLKRIVNPYGGIRMVHNSLSAYGYQLNKNIDEHFSKYRKTHNQGVFDAYTEEILQARKVGLLTGLPDAYGRGRIIGDYRRIALYGTKFLIEKKRVDCEEIKDINDRSIELRENIKEQIAALEEITKMASSYGFDITIPATNTKEAVQWLYFGYLAAVKENNGAAMSLGRTSTFLDIYIERDLELGLITEEEAQELIDQFVIKLRLVRHLRTPEYDELFSGDPTWVTESIGGMLDETKSLVTKNSFRFLHTLINLESSPEPNLTVLWSEHLPENFKKYCAKISIKTASIQYENDDIMRPIYENDYAIACCVSAMKLGEQMQYFGARCNLVKALLFSMNGGIDEITNIKAIDGFAIMDDEVLEYEKVMANYKRMLTRVVKIYVDAMNIIHYMHDKYAYEKSQMALHNTEVERLMAFGVAGLSVMADSLSAIKYAKVKPIRNEEGLAIDYKIDGDFPKFGNDCNEVDDIAVEIMEYFYQELTKHRLHRGAKHTLSILTITSNVVYGEKTGATPDGRKAKVAFAPGANPMHGRDQEGALASLNSVSKLNYKECCQDGISNTFTIIPTTIGKNIEEQQENLVDILDGYFTKGAHHLNVNVLKRQKLIEAMENPDKYPLLTIRVSGYAVRFNRLTKKQQEEVIERTFHEKL